MLSLDLFLPLQPLLFGLDHPAPVDIFDELLCQLGRVEAKWAGKRNPNHGFPVIIPTADLSVEIRQFNFQDGTTANGLASHLGEPLFPTSTRFDYSHGLSSSMFPQSPDSHT